MEIVNGGLAETLAKAKFRYIKLGRANVWAAEAIANNQIQLGHHSVPHDLALRGDRDEIIAFLIGLGRTAGKAKDFAREIMDFYTLGCDTIWITFWKDALYWAIADPEVVFLGDGGETHGSRMRRLSTPWRDVDLLGRRLRQDELSTRLTKVAAYRQTLCGIEDEEYLRRKLAGLEDPQIATAVAARKSMVAAAAMLIGGLHWADFETLVDLLLARAGWHRVSVLGGTQKDADLMVEQPVTGETAMVQVKSRASQQVLDDYIIRFDEKPICSRMIFAYHTAKTPLNDKDRPDITLWNRVTMAEATIKTGLFDWLIARAA